MRKPTHSLVAAVAASFLLGMTGQSTAADILDGDSGQGDALLRVGPTGIFCVRSPCPWRGVLRADAIGRASGEVLWAGEVPPEIDADPTDRQRILDAWQEFDCILVDGRFEGSTLTIDRVAGNC